MARICALQQGFILATICPSKLAQLVTRFLQHQLCAAARCQACHRKDCRTCLANLDERDSPKEAFMAVFSATQRQRDGNDCPDTSRSSEAPPPHAFPETSERQHKNRQSKKNFFSYFSHRAISAALSGSSPWSRLWLRLHLWLRLRLRLRPGCGYGVCGVCPCALGWATTTAPLEDSASPSP